MNNNTKNYTYSMEAIDPDGKVVFLNETNKAKGYRKSWFKTEESARKAMVHRIEAFELLGYKITNWTLYSNIKGVGIIDAMVRS